MRTFGALLAVLWLGLTVVEAQTSPLPAEGTWRYVGGAEQEAARHAAIDAALEEVPRLFRGRVRTRIRERTRPAPRFVVSRRGDRVTFEGRGRRVTLPLDGAEQTVRGDEGPERVRAWIEDGYLRFLGRRDGNQRTLTYAPQGDRMTVHVHIQSERLEEPIAFQLSYARAE